MRVSRYCTDDKAQWDAFVHSSKNGTFILLRDYMEYHADRFRDHSLLVRDGAGNLMALLPANEEGSVLVSHAGLTYAGIISDASMTTPKMLDVFKALQDYMKRSSVTQLRYKTVPHVYHGSPAEEDRYALFVHGAGLYRRDVLSIIASSGRLPFHRMRSRRIAKARKGSLATVTSTDFAAFWPLLEENLRRAHDAAPVHTLDEIRLLHRRFPDNIRLHLCFEQDEIVAGAVIYDTPWVARAQYIGSSPRGRSMGALDLLFSELIERHYADRRYFDFGSSHLGGGGTLNVGLIEQKEGFGARAIVQDFYELPVQ